MRGGADDADRAAVADDQRRHRAGADGVELRERAGLMLGERLAAGAEEGRPAALPCRPCLRLLVLDVRHEAALPAAAMRLGEALVDADLDAQGRGPDVARLAGADQRARPHRRDAGLRGDGGQRARLLAPTVGQRCVEPPGEPLRRHVVAALAVAGEQDHARRSPWNSMSVSARSPTRSVSSDTTSAGSMLPTLTSLPNFSMKKICCARCGASKMSRSTSISCAISSTRPVRTSPSGR